MGDSDSTPGREPEVGHLRSVVGLVWRSVVVWLLLLALACLLAMAWVAQPLAWLRHRAPLLLQAADLAQLPPWPQARGEVNALAGVLRTLAQQRQQLRP